MHPPLEHSLARLEHALAHLDTLSLPLPPVIDRSPGLPNPPQPVGPVAIPGRIKYAASIRKEIEYLQRVSTIQDPLFLTLLACS